MVMTRPDTDILACLSETERSHARQFPGGRGSDPAWAVWYANYLLDEVDLNQFTSRQWEADELAEALSHLAGAYEHSSQNQPWRVYASARLKL